MFKICDDQKTKLPLSLLIMLSLLSPLQLFIFIPNITSLFLLDNNLIINKYITITVYVLIMVITTIYIMFKPKHSFLLTKIFSVIILLSLIIINFMNLNILSYLLIVPYLIMIVTSIILYIHYLNYNTVWKLFISSTISLSIINLILNYIQFKYLIIILFILYTTGLFIIKINTSVIDNKIKNDKPSPIILVGTFIVINLASFFGYFALLFSYFLNNGSNILYISLLLGVLILLVVKNKFKIDTFHIINTYISIAFIGFALVLIPELRHLAIIFLSFGVIATNISYFLCNTLYYSFKTSLILLFIILNNIIVLLLTTYLFYILKNNIQNIITLFFIITIIMYIIIFTLMPFISNEYKKTMSKNNHTFYFDTLSKRENEIVKYLLSGYTSGGIAKELFISLPTVKTHISNIYRKLNINSKQELFKLLNEDNK